tara:strand:+ start:60 stop:506 length:447 start_codon:yes stop_codon:yes gene_type:complete
MTKKTPKNPVGRPSKHTIELADIICERIADGESLRGICKDEDMPAKTSVFRWLAKKENQEFRDQYALAKTECGETEFDEIKDIIDAEPAYFYDEKGNRRIDTGWIQLQRLRADKRQWRASKLTPKKYGDKQQDDNKNMTIIINDKSKD